MAPHFFAVYLQKQRFMPGSSVILGEGAKKAAN